MHKIIDKWLLEANRRDDIILKNKLWKLSDYELMPNHRPKIKDEVYKILNDMKQTDDVKEIKKYFGMIEDTGELQEEEQEELF